MGSGRMAHAADFPLDDLVAAKGDRAVSVCLPARDEAATVGLIVETVMRELVQRVPLVDEVLVVDDGSGDGTARVAAGAGATVVAAADVLRSCGPGAGKGEALWKATAVAKGDLLVFCDADVREFDAAFVSGLLGPLCTDPRIGFVKGCYRRPVDGVAGAGGRVTELVARPLLWSFFPHLAPVVQPLAGEFAARREVLEQLPFVQGYGVDLALLVDVTSRFGTEVLAQVDLGTRIHRNRPLHELSLQAAAVLHAALDRAGVATPAGRPPVLGTPGRPPVAIEVGERPPLVEVAAYCRRG